MRFLRFDLCSTRTARSEIDQFALISDIWNRFVGNSISRYKPGENITINEQRFPTKFGIEFWLAVNVESKYILNFVPYLSKDESRSSTQRLSDHVAMTLMGKARNVTTDNFSRRFYFPKS